MIVRINHPNIEGNEKTYLTVAASDGDTALTVQNMEGFSANDYVVVGKLGEEKTELRKVASVTEDTTITTDALSFDHSVNTPITFIGFNQVAIYSSSTQTGTYTIVGSATDIEVDQDHTEIDDSSGSTSTWYKSRYYNATTSTYSTYSDTVQGSGYTEDSLREILNRASAMANDRNDKIYTEDEKIKLVNVGYQKAINRLEKADHKRFVKKGYVDIKNSYNTGTVDVSDGSTDVTGSSTVWDTGWTGKKIVFSDEGFPYEIASVDSSTTLTLTKAYSQDGEDLDDATYKIFQDEYDIHDESTGVEVVDFKKIEQVINEEGTIVNEFDLHRTENGYYLKRQGTSLKFCLNYYPDTSDDEGRWTVWYRYQPSKLDSMADEPEFPAGYSGILDYYLASKIRAKADDITAAGNFMGEFIDAVNKMIRESVPRTNEKRGFRLDRNLKVGKVHDADWGDRVYSRRTVGT